MFNILLILLGSMLIFITIMIVIAFMIAGGFRKSLVNIKVLIASAIIGLLMIALGVLPWGIALVVGIVGLAVGGFAFFFFVWLPSYKEGRLREEVPEVRKYIRREHIKPSLRFLLRVVIVSGAILLFDVIGLWFFLFVRGQWNLVGFIEFLTLLLLLEGSLVGAGGAFIFYGFSEYRLMRQAALWPTLADDQVRKWRERRLSQQKWGIAMLIAGILLIFLGLLVSVLASV